MKTDMSRILVGIVVKEGLKSIRRNPERAVRNLVDKALQFSGGRFQRHFFTAAQTMLQQEDSAYYQLIRETVTHVELDRLYTFGMNLGYNGCTAGARRIRENEGRLGCNIPWTVALELAPTPFWQDRYHSLIREGEELGIYVWMLFAPQCAPDSLELALAHPDSAFVLFCRGEALSPELLAAVERLPNLMLALQWDEAAPDACRLLQERGLLYSVWLRYGAEDLTRLDDGQLFRQTGQYTPLFTGLLPEGDCPEAVQRQAYQAVLEVREGQSCPTIAWEMQGDNRAVDAIISEDSCAVCFDREGRLCDWTRPVGDGSCNLMGHTLTEILQSACPKERENKE